MKFSNRVPDDLTSNQLSEALQRHQKNLIDLTISNPTECGFEYPKELFDTLLQEVPSTYSPDSQGLLKAREAVSRDFQRQGLSIPAKDIFLTSGTSEAYSLLFKILAEPGESILFPSPGYPLIEHLAKAEGLEALPYGLDPESAGAVDFTAFGHNHPDNVRAVVAIQPHNPLGTNLSHKDLLELDTWCSQKGSALLLDEVFWDYVWDTTPTRPSFGPRSLTVHMGGLSKSVGLPQLKCSWFGLLGPQDVVEEARIRLEFLSDLYLSVGTPVQNALPSLLEQGSYLREQILRRVKANRKHLMEAARHWEGRLLVVPAQAGWASILEVTDPTEDEESYAMRFLDAGVYVMPGYFFSMEEGLHFVISLLVPEEIFKAGLSRLSSCLLR